jgi:hypothetical protein
VTAFSEIKRIEAAIANKNAKELEWSLWYCQMRQNVPSARRQHNKYWSGVEDTVRAAMAPPVAAKEFPVRKKKKRAARGLGLGPVENSAGDGEV